MKKEGILYVIKNDINDKVYIGKTYSSLNQRWNLHISDSKKESRKTRPLYNAMNKHGIDHFYIEEIGRFPQDVLEEKEIEYIELYDSYKNGYNATKGGDGRRYAKPINEKFTEEEIDRIVELYYIYPNVSYIAKELHVHIRTIHEILEYKNISTLPMKTLTEIDNKKHIYQTLNGKIINIFNTYEEVMNYVNKNKLGKISSTDSLRASLSLNNNAFGYEWKIIPLTNVFKYYVSNMMQNN